MTMRRGNHISSVLRAMGTPKEEKPAEARDTVTSELE